MRLRTYLICIGVLVLFLQTNIVLAQQTTTEVTPQTENAIKEVAAQQSLPIDTVTIGGIAASTVGLLVNDRKDKKKLEDQLAQKDAESKIKEEEQKKKDREQAEIMGTMMLTMYKFFYASYMYGNRTNKDIMDLKSTNNPIEKNTIGYDMTDLANKLGRFIVVNYNIPMPNMSVASEQVINASSIKPNTHTTGTTTTDSKTTSSTTTQ